MAIYRHLLHISIFLLASAEPAFALEGSRLFFTAKCFANAEGEDPFLAARGSSYNSYGGVDRNQQEATASTAKVLASFWAVHDWIASTQFKYLGDRRANIARDWMSTRGNNLNEMPAFENMSYLPEKRYRITYSLYEIPDSSGLYHLHIQDNELHPAYTIESLTAALGLLRNLAQLENVRPSRQAIQGLDFTRIGKITYNSHLRIIPDMRSFTGEQMNRDVAKWSSAHANLAVLSKYFFGGRRISREDICRSVAETERTLCVNNLSLFNAPTSAMPTVGESTSEVSYYQSGYVRALERDNIGEPVALTLSDVSITGSVNVTFSPIDRSAPFGIIDNISQYSRENRETLRASFDTLSDELTPILKQMNKWSHNYIANRTLDSMVHKYLYAGAYPQNAIQNYNQLDQDIAALVRTDATTQGLAETTRQRQVSTATQLAQANTNFDLKTTLFQTYVNQSLTSLQSMANITYGYTAENLRAPQRTLERHAIETLVKVGMLETYLNGLRTLFTTSVSEASEPAVPTQELIRQMQRLYPAQRQGINTILTIHEKIDNKQTEIRSESAARSRVRQNQWNTGIQTAWHDTRLSMLRGELATLVEQRTTSYTNMLQQVAALKTELTQTISNIQVLKRELPERLSRMRSLALANDGILLTLRRLKTARVITPEELREIERKRSELASTQTLIVQQFQNLSRLFLGSLSAIESPLFFHVRRLFGAENFERTDQAPTGSERAMRIYIDTLAQIRRPLSTFDNSVKATEITQLTRIVVTINNLTPLRSQLDTQLLQQQKVAEVSAGKLNYFRAEKYLQGMILTAHKLLPENSNFPTITLEMPFGDTTLVPQILQRTGLRGMNSLLVLRQSISRGSFEERRSIMNTIYPVIYRDFLRLAKHTPILGDNADFVLTNSNPGKDYFYRGNTEALHNNAFLRLTDEMIRSIELKSGSGDNKFMDSSDGNSLIRCDALTAIVAALDQELGSTRYRDPRERQFRHSGAFNVMPVTYEEEHLGRRLVIDSYDRHATGEMYGGNSRRLALVYKTGTVNHNVGLTGYINTANNDLVRTVNVNEKPWLERYANKLYFSYFNNTMVGPGSRNSDMSYRRKIVGDLDFITETRGGFAYARQIDFIPDFLNRVSYPFTENSDPDAYMIPDSEVAATP